MANETWHSPYDVMVGAVGVKKVDRIAHSDQAAVEAHYGDNAVHPTFNRALQKRERLVITTRDYAAWMALARGTAGNVTWKVEIAGGGSAVTLTFSGGIVVDRSGDWGSGRINAGTITIEVEVAPGGTGGLAS